jgi:hypothetical protein
MVESILLAYFIHQFALPSSQMQMEKAAQNGAQITVELQQGPVQSLQQGAQRVPMLTLHITASCSEDIQLQSIRVRRRGLGSSSDILSVYAMSDGQRLNRGRQLSRTGYAQLQFRNVQIPACDTKTILILADFSPDAAVAGEHWMTVEHASDIDTGIARISLVRSSKTPLKHATTGGRTRGTITVEYLSLLKTVRYGSNRTVARIRLEADGRDDHLIGAMTFTNDGSARNTDLQRLYLRAGRSRRLSRSVQQLNGDTVRLVLDPPLVLKKNQKRLLELQADVRAGRRKTLRLIIEEPSDIEAEPARVR